MGLDLDLHGTKDLKAAEHTFASLNFSSIVLTEILKSSKDLWFGATRILFNYVFQLNSLKQSHRVQ